MKTIKLWSKKEVLDFKKRWHAITIPVNIQIKNKQITLDLKRVERIIMAGDRIALGDCACRSTLNNCDFPLNTCIFFNDRAERMVECERAKWITKKEAITVAINTHNQGLVHLAIHSSEDTAQLPSEICSCCSCCCRALQGLKHTNIGELVEQSEFITTHDPESCINCGECIDWCHFKARVLDSNDNLIFKPELCFGCGLCVTSCPERIIELIKR
ncbi:MAG: ATP-binding protein [Candidatus Hodarchaeales archaeon]|jgi:Pyruvate/2-oxoacid:ferredoxin oxidoreductase delta subunit